MIYAKDQKPKSPFVSVNTLLQPQSKNRKSLQPPLAETPPEVVNHPEADKEETELEPVQSKGFTAAAGRADDPGLGAKLQNFRGGGEALPNKVQAQLGPALGMDLGEVRVHHDAPAAALAESLGARAFTNREDIYFNRSEYNPETPAGTRLLAHELAHVQQQQTVPGLQYRLPNPAERDRYEREADAVADQAVNSPVQAKRKPRLASVAGSSAGVSVQLAEAKGREEPNWLLEKVSGLVRNLPGYDLLTLALGRDPFTGQAVKGDGLAWGKALAGLLPGGAALFENLEKAKVISKAVAWFKEEFVKLGLTFAAIKSLFDQAWAAIVGPQARQPEASGTKQGGWLDKVAQGVKDLGSTVASIGKALLSPEETFNKLKQIFLAPINRIGSFIAKAGPKLMEFIFEGAMALAGNAGQKIIGILNQGKGVLQQIINDPIGFLKNLITAVRTGLGNFLSHLGAYLQTGLAGWLFGTLGKAGISLPEKLNLAGIFSLMAQILNVTWQAIRAQVVKRLGPIAEKVMEQVEKGIAVVTAFITKGPIALLEMAQEFLGELQTLFFDTFIGWLRNTVIGKAVQKLISMFNPVGALVQGVITIYNMIQFFLERAKQIAALVNAVFNSIAEIAAGNLKKAVAAVEDSLAKALPVAISFMANLVGIGGLTAKIKEIIQKIRAPIDKAVAKVVGFVADKAKALIARIRGTDQPKEEPPQTEAEHDAQVEAGLAALDKEQQKEDADHNNALTEDEAIAAAQRVKRAFPVFKSITPVEQGGRWVFEYVASPGEKHVGFKVEALEPQVVIRNWKGVIVKIPKGHVMSPRDPDFSEPPIVVKGPFSEIQRNDFLKGNSAETKLAPHHRHQIPVRDGGVIDELRGPGHPQGNEHTFGSPSRHPGKSVFNSEPGGNKLRNDEIKAHWRGKGARLVEINPGIWRDPGEK